jgi:2-alkyl-3-oxoalkanoate reductase
VGNLAHHAQETLLEQFIFATHATQTLLQASVEAHVKKFIHISSTAVYGDPPPSGVITEASPCLASVIPHTSMQQTAERCVLTAETSDTEVIVLQPSRIYGPGENGETAQMLQQMKTAFMPLARYGTGYCNPIYIDDALTAILRACAIPHLHRERFIISPDQFIRWSEFLTSYESILGEKTFINLPIDYYCNPQDSIPPLRGFVSQLLKKKKVMEGTSAIAKALYGKPIRYPSPDEFRAMVAQPIFSNQKARDRLRFQPEISLQAGMDKIREWWHHRSVET